MVLIAWPVWVVGKALEWVLYALFWPVRRLWGDKEPETASKS